MDFEAELNYYEMVLIRKKKGSSSKQKLLIFISNSYFLIYSESWKSFGLKCFKKSWFSSSLYSLFRNIDCNNNYVVYIGF